MISVMYGDCLSTGGISGRYKVVLLTIVFNIVLATTTDGDD